MMRLRFHRPPFHIFYYAVISVSLLLLSYTQVDLNLTLSRAGRIQSLQKAFQYVGFYNRPLSTVLYIGIICAFFAGYVYVLHQTNTKKFGVRDVWTLIYVTAGILVFSYPAAFSYDFFNYLFTAKTVLVYHQNPYVVTPLGFASIDPWTNFMRWTHLTSAYTPLWIVMSLIPFLLGGGYFISVLFMMKFMIAGFYLLACVMLSLVLRRILPKNEAFGLAVFALQPLILVESLVSGHNDIVLVAFALLSIVYLVQKEFLISWFTLAVSIAAKLMTIVLIPVYFFNKDKKWMLGSMIVALILVLLRREFLPWYFVWIIPFIALNSEFPKLIRFSCILSFGLLLSYAPYLYWGEYSVRMQLWKTYTIWSGVGIAVLSFFVPHDDHSDR